MTREEFVAKAIIAALLTDEPSARVDSDLAQSCCIVGYFNLLNVARLVVKACDIVLVDACDD